MPESRTDRFDKLVAPHLDTLLRETTRGAGGDQRGQSVSPP